MPVSVVAVDLVPVHLFGPVVETRAFAIGLLYGAFAYLATGLIAALRRKTREGGGVAFAAAVFIALRDVYANAAAPVLFGVAIVLLGIGGWVAARGRPRIWARWYVSFGRTAALLLPGSFALVVAFPAGTPLWMRVSAGLAALVTGVLVHDFDAAQGPRGAPFLLLALAAVAVYFVVPDTELPLVMLGCSVPLALLSVPQPLRRLGPAGTTAAMGVFVWVSVVGGRGRAGSVVAAIAALGLLLVEPIGRRIPKSTVAEGRRRRQPRPTDKWLAVIAVAGLAQLALGLFCAKISGRENDAVLAALMTAPMLVLLGAAAPFLLPTEDHSRRKPSRKSKGPGPHRRSRRYAWMH